MSEVFPTSQGAEKSRGWDEGKGFGGKRDINLDDFSGCHCQLASDLVPTAAVTTENVDLSSNSSRIMLLATVNSNCNYRRELLSTPMIKMKQYIHFLHA
jgi:hypothetical protein